MASIITGYEYDIFISYRQKDNKGDKWVSEFVEALKTELESTFKEEISVYFDINPHDGLLETHDVDASLKDKLKCLVFIPIISRTYCDQKSFAWQHEFNEFISKASQDKFGQKVKVHGGNIANRILPVQIHELNKNDMKLVENMLGGNMRGIEFIYKEPGVNRPLNPEDDEKKNLNNTKYRNQINKVANAVSEIIEGLRSPVRIDMGDSQVSNEAIPSVIVSHRTKRIAGSLILLAFLIACYLIIPKLRKSSAQLEKSIAVLPFTNDSPNDSTTYFLNGVMEEVLNNLSKIKDFSRVLSRTSTDQYKGPNRPTIPEIGKKLGVNFIVEGSGQKYSNTIRLRVQLIATRNERHVWGDSYEQEINDTKDLFKIQSQIAQAVALALKAIITPEEKHLIEKNPTISLTAYNFYLRGKEEIFRFGIDANSREAVKKAETLFKKSLQCDSTFANAYTGLAMVYWKKKFFEENRTKNYLDSMLLLANTALFYDNQSAEAYWIRGGYYAEKNDTTKALKEYDKAIGFNPNDWQLYYGKGWLYYWDIVRSIENYQKAASLNHGSQLPELLRTLASLFYQAGFPEKGKSYNLEAYNLDGDSCKFMNNLVDYEYTNGDFKTSLDLLERISLKEPAFPNIEMSLGINYLALGQFKESLKYFKIWMEKVKANRVIPYSTIFQYIGYAYWKNGDKKEAEYYFDKHIEHCNYLIKSFPNLKFHYYDLAGIYAFKGQKDKAFQSLRVFTKIQRLTLGYVTWIKNDPLFNSIRNEPEFQQIVRDVEAKYQAEHGRVRKWLEEQGML